MAEDILWKWKDFQLSRTHDLDLGWSHTAYQHHHSLTSTYMPNFIEIEETLYGRTNVCMYVCTDAHFRPTLLGRLRRVDLIISTCCWKYDSGARICPSWVKNYRPMLSGRHSSWFWDRSRSVRLDSPPISSGSFVNLFSDKSSCASLFRPPISCVTDAQHEGEINEVRWVKVSGGDEGRWTNRVGLMGKVCEMGHKRETKWGLYW